LALRIAIADLLELLHGLPELAAESEVLRKLELRGGRGVAGRVLQRDPARGLRGLGQAPALAVREAARVEGARHPFAARIEALHARELGEGVVDVGGSGRALHGQAAEVVVGP